MHSFLIARPPYQGLQSRGCEDTCEWVIGYPFLISIYKYMKSLNADTSEFDRSPILSNPSPVLIWLRKLFLSFEKGEFKVVSDISEMVLFVTKQHGECMAQDSDSVVERTTGTPVFDKVTRALIEGILFHTKELAEAYKYAKRELHWIRFSFVHTAPHDESEVYESLAMIRQGENFEKVLRFTAMVLDSIASCKEQRDLMLTHNCTLDFMLDTLMDPTLMLEKSTASMVSDKSGPLSTEDVHMLSQYRRIYNFSDHGVQVLNNVFDKAGYDKTRTDVLKIFTELQRIEILFDEYWEAYNLIARVDHENGNCTGGHSLVRFQVLPDLRAHLLKLFDMFFHRSSREAGLVSIVEQILALRTDIVMANNFDEVNQDDEVNQAGGYYYIGNRRSKEEVLAYGQFIFHRDGIRFSLPPFLLRFCHGNMKKRLIVIDAMGANTFNVLELTKTYNVLGYDTIQLEAFAFEFLSRLLSMEEGEISKQSVAKSLVKILADETRPALLRQHLQHKSKRYDKRLANLCVRAQAQAEALSNCLSAQHACVENLLQKLERTVTSMARLPLGTEDEIDDATSEYDQYSKMVKAAALLHTWTPEELHEIYQSMVDLEDVTEKATNFLHQVTGNGFPVVRSLLSPLWTQSESEIIHSGDYTTTQLNAIKEIVCLHEILKSMKPSTSE